MNLRKPDSRDECSKWQLFYFSFGKSCKFLCIHCKNSDTLYPMQQILDIRNVGL